MLNLNTTINIIVRHAFSILIILLSTTALAQTYTVGVEDHDYCPYYNFVDLGAGCNPLREVLNEFAAQNEFSFEYVVLPVKRVKNWYSIAKIDFKLPDNPYWSDKGPNGKNPIFSEPILWINSGTIVLKQNKNLQEDEFKSVGIFNGFIPFEYWQERTKQDDVSLVEAPSVKLLTHYLYKGHIDAINGDIEPLRYQAKALGYDADALTLVEDLPIKPLEYTLSTLNHPDIIERFNRFLKSYQQSHTNQIE